MIPAAAPPGASGVAAPDVKPATPGHPYLGRLDLAVEDKARFFDRIAGLVSFFSACLCSFCHRGHGSAPDGSSPRGCKQALAVDCSLALTLTLHCVVWSLGARPVLPMGVAPKAASKRLRLVVFFF